MRYLQYADDGRILFSSDVPESLIKLQTGNIFIGDADPEKYYIRHGEAVKRQTSPVHIGLDDTLQAIPDHATIYINEKSYPATEPVCALEFTYPGTYRIRVEAFPYLDFVAEVVK